MSENIVAGMFDDFTYTHSTMKLEKNDTLILFTDGVTEAFNPEKEMFDEAGLEKTLSTMGQKDSYEMCQTIIKDVTAFADGEPQSDDITFMAIRRKK